MAKRTMHLAQCLCHGPTYHSLAMWRHPRTAAAGYDWTKPELYQHIAQVCERGKFDMVFFADLNYVSDTYTGSMAPAIRHATQAPEYDPIPLLGFMASVTSRIGLGATFSISHAHPFHAARLWATLDHLTRGRAAWNVVTTLNHNQSANYVEDLRPADERYERAHEFIPKQEEHNALGPLDGGLAILSGHLDFDLAKLSLDEPMALRTEPELQRMQTRYRTLTGELLTVREVAQRHGQSVGLLQMVGTPAQVADQMEAYIDAVGGDGFMLSPIDSPGAIEEFVDLVVPELDQGSVESVRTMRTARTRTTARAMRTRSGGIAAVATPRQSCA